MILNRTAKTFVLGTVVLTAFFVARSANAADPLPVFVFAGQSNMVGKRCLANELPSRMQLPNSRALFFVSKEKIWVPIAPGRTEPQGFGPEIAFAAAITENRDETIGIIKVSRGGTNLHRQWSPDDPDSLFGELIRTVEAAHRTRPIKVVGMIWIQGGADAKEKAMACAYETNLKGLVVHSRQQFQNPDMYFISGRIPAKDDRRKPFWKTVREAQQDLKMNHYSWVDCDDISKGPDDVHYDTAGMVKLGQRLANIMAGKVSSAYLPSSDPSPDGEPDSGTAHEN